MRDYQFEESKVVMQELIEDVASRLRAEKACANNSFSFGYAEGGGIHKQYTLEDPTNLERDIFKVINYFANRLCDKKHCIER